MFNHFIQTRTLHRVVFGIQASRAYPEGKKQKTKQALIGGMCLLEESRLKSHLSKDANI